MEKFGIFELLDTLSAITASREPEPEPIRNDPPVQKADINDAAFAPPLPQNGSPTPAQTSAFSALIARHDNISKKIDGQNKS